MKSENLCENVDDSYRVDTNEEDIALSMSDPQAQETHNLESKDTVRESYFKEEPKNITFEQSRLFI